MNRPDGIRFTNTAGRPNQSMLNEYKRLAQTSRRPVYVCRTPSWEVLEYLDPNRMDPAYYYFHPSGRYAFGIHAEEEVTATLRM